MNTDSALAPCSISLVNDLHISRTFDHPAARVFDALADQDRMGRWMGARISVPVRGPDSLVGTVRRIHVGPIHFDERIVDVAPGREISYEICSPVFGLKHHQGLVRVDPITDGSCRVSWTVELELFSSALGSVVRAGLRAALARALGKLDRQLQKSH